MNQIVLDAIMLSVQIELRNQDEKWGERRVLNRRTWLAVLMEEVGEVAKAELEHSPDEYLKELIQVAAVAMQMIAAEMPEWEVSALNYVSEGEVMGAIDDLARETMANCIHDWAGVHSQGGRFRVCRKCGMWEHG